MVKEETINRINSLTNSVSQDSSNTVVNDGSTTMTNTTHGCWRQSPRVLMSPAHNFLAVEKISYVHSELMRMLLTICQYRKNSDGSGLMTVQEYKRETFKRI